VTHPALKEAGFQDTVAEFARSRGWLVSHFRPGTVRAGRTITNAAYDGAGFPDLTMVRADRLVFAELKRQGVRKLGVQQQTWAVALMKVEAANPGVEWHLWNPLDWEKIEDVLR